MSIRYCRAVLVAMLLLAELGDVLAGDGVIQVVVPGDKPSRPAHFNWVFKSANGQAPRVGQFACGSYWVAPADGDKGVTLVSLVGSSEWKDLLSCDADPVTERHGLLNDKNKYGNHDATEDILPKLPMAFTPNSNSCVSLVAAMQRDEAATSPGGAAAIRGEVVDAYCVVTVMPQAPKDGGRNMIRPNITGAHKEFLTWDDFALDRLPRIAFLRGNTAKEWESVQRRWRHSSEIFGMAAEIKTQRGTRFDGFSEGGRAFRSCLLLPNYGSGTARAFHGDLFALFSAESRLEEMKSALAAMLAYGLDIYHARYDYGKEARKCWSSGAGQWMGQFLPPVFAAALLKDEGKAHQLRQAAITNHGKDPGERGPQELRQIKRGVTGVLLWGDGQPIEREGNKMVEQDWRYWADLTGSKCYDSYDGKGDPNRGQKTATDPYGYIDGPANQPGSSYMSVSFGGFHAVAAAMILMPEIRSVVNTDAPIEYVDRLARHGLWTWPDPVAAPAKGDQETARLWWSVEGCKEWGTTWGARADDVRFAIEDGQGRFKRMHRQKMEGGYECEQIRSLWDKIIALYDGPRYEDYFVPPGKVVAPEIVFATGDKPQAYLSCATPDARIHYTLDGSDPTGASAVYADAPISVAAKATVKAFAELKGKESSAIRSKAVPPPLSALPKGLRPR